jgi:hypothetical protein
MLAGIINQMLIGSIFGVLLAAVGRYMHIRYNVKRGLFVDFKYIHLDPTLLYYLKEIRPHYQTSKYTVSLHFVHFVKRIDDALMFLSTGGEITDLAFATDTIKLLTDASQIDPPASLAVVQQLLGDFIHPTGH